MVLLILLLSGFVIADGSCYDYYLRYVSAHNISNAPLGSCYFLQVSDLESQIDNFEAEVEGLSIKKGKQRPPRLVRTALFIPF